MVAQTMKRKARAFVLIETAPGEEKNVMEGVLKIDEVKEAHIYSGQMDIIAVLEVEREVVVPGSQKITDVVIDRIQRVDGVQDTETLIPTYSKTKWPELI